MGLTTESSEAAERVPFINSSDCSDTGATRDRRAESHGDDDDSCNERSMSVAERLYAYDLTLATLTYQRFGQNPKGRLLWEVLSHTGDGILYVD